MHSTRRTKRQGCRARRAAAAAAMTAAAAVTAAVLLMAPVSAPEAAAQPPAYAPAPDWIVVPGYGIGVWHLDRVNADYLWQLGVPDARLSGTDVMFRRDLNETSWYSPAIAVLYPPASDTVWAVGTNDPRAQTAEHVGIGSTEAQITAAYGAPSLVVTVPIRARTMVYDGRGVAFEMPYVAATGQYYPTAYRIWVFRPGQAAGIWRLP